PNPCGEVRRMVGPDRRRTTSRGTGNQPLRVLILADQALIGRFVELTLPLAAYLVRSAANPAAAGATLDAWRPHLVVADMDVGGAQLVERIGLGPAGGTR